MLAIFSDCSVLKYIQVIFIYAVLTGVLAAHMLVGSKKKFINTLSSEENGCHVADGILKCIFFNESHYLLNHISLKFVPKDPVNTKSALVQVMAWKQWLWFKLKYPVFHENHSR